MTRRVLVLCGKEIRETLRDRRTLAVTVGLPFLVYPALAIALAEWMAGHVRRQEETVSRVAVRGPDAARREVEAALRGDRRLAIVEGPADVTVEAPADFAERLGAGHTAELRVLYDRGDDAAELGRERVVRALEERERALVRERLGRRGVDPGVLDPWRVEEVSIAAPERVGGRLIGRVLPMLFVMIVVLGAFYPAIDLTAGEKERGTLETLLSAPISAAEIVAGKFLAVAVAALVAGAANLASIGATFLWVFRDALRGADALPAVPWGALLAAVAVLVPATALVSAVLLAVACTARGFKDAQNQLTPVYLALVLPALLAQLPGATLGWANAWVPGVNLGLLVRALVEGGAVPAGPAALALGSTLGYAALALALAARIFSGERLLFAPDEDRAGAARPARDAATLPEALAALGVVLLLAIYAGARLQAWRFVPGMLVTEWLLVLGPCLALARFAPLSRRAFAAGRPGAAAIAGGLLAGACAWALGAALVQWVQQPIAPAPEELVEAMRAMVFPDPPRSLALDLLVLAVSPAVCEEVLFRGLILRASVGRLGPAAAVALNAVLFGAFHLSAWRFLPTAALGALLALASLRARSLWPAMALHAAHNAAILLLARAVGPGAAGGPTGAGPPLPVGIVAAAAAAVAVGIWLCGARRDSVLRHDEGAPG